MGFAKQKDAVNSLMDSTKRDRTDFNMINIMGSNSVGQSL
jgi:hypothetical protein